MAHPLDDPVNHSCFQQGAVTFTGSRNKQNGQAAR